MSTEADARMLIDKEPEACVISLGVPFILLINSLEHYFWNYADKDTNGVMRFPCQVDLVHTPLVAIFASYLLRIRQCVRVLPKFICRCLQMETEVHFQSSLQVRVF